MATERLDVAREPNQARDLSTEEWLAERATYALAELRNCVETNPHKCGGVPVFKGTRFTLARFLAELADGRSVSSIASDFELDADLLEQFLRGLSICLDRPALK